MLNTKTPDYSFTHFAKDEPITLNKEARQQYNPYVNNSGTVLCNTYTYIYT